MTVCGTVGGKSLDPRTGRVLKTIPQVGDADEVWYDPGSNGYYFAHVWRAPQKQLPPSGEQLGS